MQLLPVHLVGTSWQLVDPARLLHLQRTVCQTNPDIHILLHDLHIQLLELFYHLTWPTRSLLTYSVACQCTRRHQELRIEKRDGGIGIAFHLLYDGLHSTANRVIAHGIKVQPTFDRKASQFHLGQLFLVGLPTFVAESKRQLQSAINRQIARSLMFDRPELDDHVELWRNGQCSIIGDGWAVNFRFWFGMVAAKRARTIGIIFFRSELVTITSSVPDLDRLIVYCNCTPAPAGQLHS